MSFVGFIPIYGDAFEIGWALFRGNYTDAGIAVLGIFPIFDLLKFRKFSKLNKMVTKVPVDETIGVGIKYSDEIGEAATKQFSKSVVEDITEETVEKVSKEIGEEVIEGGVDSVKKPYSNSRPKYGKDQVQDVFENAKQPDGKVYDPNTGEELSWDKSKPRNGQWDMGHTQENKYSEWHKKYLDGDISKEEFLDWYRNPNNYSPESPSANRSHKYE